MSREQILKIAMVVCVVVLLCAVIITSTGLFGSSGIGGYANADKYTAGDTELSREITGEIKNLEISWTSGKVTVAYHAENTITLRESAGRALSEDEKLQWWLDGDTLRIQFTKPGIRWNMPGKELTVTLPEGIAFRDVNIQTTSGDVAIPALKAEKMDIGSTSGDLKVEAETARAVLGSTSGDMTIRLSGNTDSVTLGSTSGRIGLEAEKAGSIKAGSTSGGISIAASEADMVKAGSTSGSIYAELRKINTLELSTTSGNVTVKLPAEPGFTAKVGTTSGSFTYDIALAKNGDRYVCGDGSAKVEIGTTSGDVRMEAAD